LKYRKQLQTHHETPRVFCPASGNTVLIYVSTSCLFVSSSFTSGYEILI